MAVIADHDELSRLRAVNEFSRRLISNDHASHRHMRTASVPSSHLLGE
jgi:hypothetical protein